MKLGPVPPFVFFERNITERGLIAQIIYKGGRWAVNILQ